MAAALLTDSQMQEWGWRLPFLLSVVISFVGFRLRRDPEETPAMADEATEPHMPLSETVRSAWRPVVRYVSLILFVAALSLVAIMRIPETLPRQRIQAT